MELEELLQKIQEESIQYTGISNVKIYNELREELKGIKIDIGNNKVTLKF